MTGDDTVRRLDRFRERFEFRRIVVISWIWWRWAALRHRLGLHTWLETDFWDLEAGTYQYRGVRCANCDVERTSW